MHETVDRGRAFVRRWPKVALGWNVLAAACEAVGNLEEAARAYDKGLKLEPDNVAARNNLGNVLRALGACDDARVAFEAVLRRSPDFAEARHNLGLALADAERWEEAVSAYRAALARAPDMVDGYNNLANALLALGCPEEAERVYRQALERAPDYAQVRSNLGNVLTRLHRFEAALAAHARAVELAPGAAQIRQNRALTLIEVQDFAAAEDELREALRLVPDDDGIRLNLANVRKYRGGFEEAEALYRELLARYPQRASSHTDLANLLGDLGRSGEAAEHYRRAIELDPGYPFALYGLAMARRFADRDDPDLRLLEGVLGRADVGVDALHAAHARYAVAKGLDDIGADPDEVFDLYTAGAAAKRSTFDYDIAAEEESLVEVARVCAAGRLPTAPAAPGLSPAPLFIVGMPRSGTTLVEQILASHPEVNAGGERQELMRLTERATERAGCDFPTWLERALTEGVDELARGYRRLVGDAVAGAPRYLTDKMPSNYKLLGLMATAFPDARVIHVRRNPVDTCLSCFTHLFAQGQWFSYDLEELGRYYRAYDRLMGHWRQALPGGWMIELEYEELIASPETQTRRLLDHCGLAWAPECLEFHRTSRRVATASSQQVRQPLYRSAIERWRRFEPHLDTLRGALGPLAPY